MWRFGIGLSDVLDVYDEVALLRGLGVVFFVMVGRGVMASSIDS